MIAISAMVLPGISGSTLLLIFGLYTGIINSIKEVLHLNFSYLPVLIIFGLGVITGILSTIKLIKFLLSKYRSCYDLFNIRINAWIIICSIYGPYNFRSSQPAMNLSSFNWIFFIIGGALIIALEKFKNILEKI